MNPRTSKVSIRQPLVLYATVFMTLISAVVLSLSSFSMVRASRRAYRRAVTQQLSALVHERTLPEIRLISLLRHSEELTLTVITATTGDGAHDLAQIRRAAQSDSPSGALVAVPIPEPGIEAYLVAEYAPTIPMSIAFVEISRMVPLVIFGALACAAVLAFFIARLLLPPLDALAEVAEDPRALDSTDGLGGSGAPTEIHEVARRFRRTVRLLNDERDLVQAQRDELERMQESLVRASKLASVGRLAAGIAHEVGNPLAAVKGYLSILRSGLEEPQRSEVLQRSAKELDRIHQTIQQLLTYARHGEASSEPMQSFAVHRVLHDALNLVRGHPDLRNVRIDNQVSEDLPPVQGHPGRLNQVLVNLLLNAAQATDQQAGAQITLHTEFEGEQLRLLVTDNGPGIPPEQTQAIFDPFFTTKEPGEGTGLGLAVSRALMEAMQGDLLLRAPDGAGATFEVRLATTSSV